MKNSTTLVQLTRNAFTSSAWVAPGILLSILLAIALSSCGIGKQETSVQKATEKQSVPNMTVAMESKWVSVSQNSVSWSTETVSNIKADAEAVPKIHSSSWAAMSQAESGIANPWTVFSDWMDEISTKLENVSWQYGNFVWTKDSWITFRISDSLSWSTSFKIKNILLNDDFKLDTVKPGFINLFSVTNSSRFRTPKEILEKNFIGTKYRNYCSLNAINTKNEVTDINASEMFYDTAYVSKNLFLNKNDWIVYYISMNENLKPEATKGEILSKWYCFWVFNSAPKSYFIFKKNDLTKFLLINTTQDPYPFNPRSFKF